MTVSASRGFQTATKPNSGPTGQSTISLSTTLPTKPSSPLMRGNLSEPNQTNSFFQGCLIPFSNPFLCNWSGQLDSNQRLLGPKPSALTRLSYAPKLSADTTPPEKHRQCFSRVIASAVPTRGNW